MDYVELHGHSYFSLLDATASPAALVERAAALGMDALALTDHDAVYGAPQFAEAAAAHGIHPIYGTELTVDDQHLTLLVENETGWANLCWLITQGRHHAPKGSARLPAEQLDGHTKGLIALSGCRQGEIATALLHRDEAGAQAASRRLQALFGRDQFYIELQRHLLPDDGALVDALSAFAVRIGAETVATNNVHYAERAEHELQDVLVCIRHHQPLDENSYLRVNSEYYLKSPRQMARLFAEYPDALAATRRIAERCQFRLRGGLQDLPPFPTPAGQSAEACLRVSAEAGARWRFGAVGERVRRQLDYELTVIGRAGLANYFLIVWDIVRFARERQILCQGRGSAANSLVAYVLGISPVDPIAHDLMFERFLSDERQSAPDIDLDFESPARREEVIQYVYECWGRDHAAMACTFSTFRARSAIRDVGKALGLSPDLIDRAAKAADRFGSSEASGVQDLLGDGTSAPVIAHLLDLCEQINGLPRHVGIHNGAFVLTGASITSRLPTEPAMMPGRTVVQWDKDGLDSTGMVKIDVLGLRMLAAVAEAKAIVETQTGQTLDLERLPFDDPAVYANITDADTIGVFQVESRAQMTVLPRLKPTVFNDLVVCISLIRPGPIQGNMVHPYLRRRLGEEPVVYMHKSLERALEETLGVMLFQEQVLKVARDMAGFTPGQGELLRRALGSKRSYDAIERLHDTFVAGATRLGAPAAIAEQVFDALRAFGGYSFPKSHAAAFATLVYRSAWLKTYHPQAFYAAILNNQPMGFWQPAIIANDAQRRDIRVLPPDIQRSAGRCTIEGESIRIGFNYVKGFGEPAIERLLSVRGQGTFASLGDLCRRTQLPRRLVQNLILAGVLDEWGMRRQLLWELGTISYATDDLGLRFDDNGIDFAPLTIEEAMLLEYQMLGLNLREHPMSLYRDELDRRGIVSGGALHSYPDGALVRYAGLVVVHQSPPTAHGVHFVTCEDEDGLADVIVFPNVYARYRRVIRGSPLLLVEGIIQQQDGVTNVLAGRVQLLNRDVLKQYPAVKRLAERDPVRS